MYLAIAYCSRVVTTMNIAPDQDSTYISFGSCLSGGNKFNTRKTGSKRYVSTILISDQVLFLRSVRKLDFSRFVR